VVFRYFPLDMHAWARPAAQATACAQEQGDEYFWWMHDFLFEHQREITPENLLDRLQNEAKRYRRFDSARYGRCVAAKQTAGKVERDIRFGMENGVNGTPTMFVNSQRVAGGVVAPEQLRTLIKEARATKISSATEPRRTPAPASRQ
jgi:protein-disulfide isomerase